MERKGTIEGSKKICGQPLEVVLMQRKDGAMDKGKFAVKFQKGGSQLGVLAQIAKKCCFSPYSQKRSKWPKSTFFLKVQNKSVKMFSHDFGWLRLSHWVSYAMNERPLHC